MKLTQMKTPCEQPLVEFEYDDWARRALAAAAVSNVNNYIDTINSQLYLYAWDADDNDHAAPVVIVYPITDNGDVVSWACIADVFYGASLWGFPHIGCEISNLSDEELKLYQKLREANV